MRFLFHAEAGLATLALAGDALTHLKALRLREGETLFLRTLQDDLLHEYRLESFGRRDAVLTRLDSRLEAVLPSKNTHLAWCVVDPKTVEKALPFLNELGLGTLTLLWCEKSQRSFRFDFERMARILAVSCEQCGRSRPLAIQIAECGDFLAANPRAALLDFGGKPLNGALDEKTVLIIGPEGGFGPADYARFKELPRYGVSSPLVLRSETALVLAAGAFLL